MSTASPYPHGTASPAGTTAGSAIASLGRRTAAGAVDVLLVTGLFLAVSIASGGAETSDSSFSFNVSGWPALALTVGVLGYFFLFELLLAASIGKLLLGLRVVREDGSVAGAGAIAIRTLLRLVDGIFFYLVAFVTVAATPRNQRVGDLAGKTIVVRSSSRPG